MVFMYRSYVLSPGSFGGTVGFWELRSPLCMHSFAAVQAFVSRCVHRHNCWAGQPISFCVGDLWPVAE